MWAQYRKSIDRRQFCVLSILYIYIYIRHEISCYRVPISPSPSTTPLNATRPCNRTSAPDPLGRGQYENGTKHPLIVCCDGEYNAQRRGPATPSAQARRACGLCRLRPVPPACSITRGAFSNTSGATLTPQPALKIGTILIRNCSPFRGNFLGTDVGRLVICRLCGK